MATLFRRNLKVTIEWNMLLILCYLLNKNTSLEMRHTIFGYHNNSAYFCLRLSKNTQNNLNILFVSNSESQHVVRVIFESSFNPPRLGMRKEHQKDFCLFPMGLLGNNSIGFLDRLTDRLNRRPTGVGSKGEKNRLKIRLRIRLRISLRFPILEKVQK